MIFRLGSLPEVPEFVPDNDWKALSEPSIWGFQLRAIPIGIISTILVTFLWMTITPLGNFFKAINFPLPILKNLIIITCLLLLHELLHAFIHPGFGISGNSMIGFWPSRMFIYTIYTGEQTRNRCLFILIVPFIIISIMPLIIAAITKIAYFEIAYISILNALLSCGDILAVIIIYKLIPQNAVIRSKGWMTFWKSNK